MKTINEVRLMGHVASDVTTQVLDNGTQFTQFSIKTREFYKSKGDQKKEINYHNCIAWNSVSKSIEELLSKNELVVIKGRLKTKRIDKEGEKSVYKTEVVIEDWTKIGYTDVDGYVPEDVAITS